MKVQTEINGQQGYLRHEGFNPEDKPDVDSAYSLTERAAEATDFDYHTAQKLREYYPEPNSDPKES